MAKRRIYEIAKDLGMNNKELVAKIRELGYEIKNQMSTLDELDAQIVVEKLSKGGKTEAAPKRTKRTVIRRRRKDADDGADGAQMIEETVTREGQQEPLRTLTEAPLEPEVDADEGAEAEAAEAVAEPEAEAAEAEAETAEAAEAIEAEEGAEAVEGEEPEAEEGAEEAAEQAPVAPKRKRTESAVVIGMRPGFRQVVPGPGRTGPGAGRFANRPGARPGGGFAGRPGGGFAGRPAPGARPGPGGFGPGMPAQPMPEEVPDAARQRRRRGTKEQEDREKEATPKRRGAKRRQILSRDDIYDITEPLQRGKRKKIASRKAKKTEVTTPKDIKRRVRVDGTITVSDLAHAMGVKAAEVIRQLMTMGEMVTINQPIDADTASVVAAEFDFQIENVAFAEEEVLAKVDTKSSAEGGKPEGVQRPPVVTVMGHVDHGKTSILDAIRKTRVVDDESGGITQHIGAYVVRNDKGSIVFIDTPGHAAFTEMRARGARATDLVVLVVAADDSVMEQTIEAINHSRAADVPILVAANKMDLPGADLAKVKQNLTEHELVTEEWGGETLVVPVSAKTGEGLDDLLDAILLQAEMLELKGDPDAPVNGVVIEAKLDKGRGPAVTVLVQEGTLKKGDYVVAGNYYGKIRALISDTGENLKQAGPATPVEILGLSGVPAAGDDVNQVASERDARKLVSHRQQKDRQEELAKAQPVRQVLFGDEAEGPSEIQIVIKADVQGSVEALRDALLRLSTEEVAVRVILEGVGAVSENDVNLAAASNGLVIGFRVRPDGKASRLAERSGVEVRMYNVIYEAIDEVRQLMAGKLAPEVREKVLGRAEVRQTFTVPKIGTIAGSYVLDGKVLRGARVRLVRDSVVVHEGRIGSLRRFKDDAREVAAGYECGIGLENYNDVQLNDVIEVFELEEFAREL